uniref:G-protein coupled receptors family 1 profile domain-containing protein n=1 Tax=Onchocerca volvulus TaxID=6282 RepID=A0A8R1XSW5_ONCVO
MNITINKIKIGDYKNATDIISTMAIMRHFLFIYAYLIIGPMLVAINIPVFLTVMIRKALRTSYLILAIVFLNNALSGMSAIFIGMKRLIISSLEEHHVVHHDCLLDVPLFLLTTFLLNGYSLLMNSADRLCVVTFPVYYYIHQKQLTCSLIVAQYVITIIAVGSTVIASLAEPKRYISHFCLLPQVYNSYFYAALMLLSSIASLFSIILMVIVVVMLKKKFGEQFLSSHSYNLLDVVPSIVQCIYMMDPHIKSQFIMMCCIHLSLLNSFNMVLIFIYRQKDLQNAIIRGFQWLICKKKNYIHPITTVGFDD